MSSCSGAFVPASAAAAPAAAAAAATNRPIISTQQPPQTSSRMTHQSNRPAEMPVEEDIAAFESLHISSPPKIPALPNRGRGVFFGDVGVVVTSATSRGTASGNCVPLLPNGGSEQNVIFGAAPITTVAGAPITDRNTSITSTTWTMTACPSPSLIPRRSPYMPAPMFLPAVTCTGKSSPASTATTAASTPGTATPILLPRAMASSSATHHQQPRDDSVAPTSIVASTSSLLLSVGAPSSTPPRATKSASLPQVLYATPKTKGGMATLLHARVPGAPEKKKAGPDEVFYYERHVKTREGQQQVSPAISGSSQSVISRELLVVAEQELMEVGINACTKTNTRECSLPTHNSSPGTLAMAATAEEPTQMSPMSSRPTKFETEEERSSQLMDNLMAALEATVHSGNEHNDNATRQLFPEGTSPTRSKTSEKKKQTKKKSPKTIQLGNITTVGPSPVAIRNMSRHQILSAIPDPIKSRFKELGFAQWGENMIFPVIELGPYDIPLDDVREEWMTKFEKSRRGSRKMHRLVYWYGSDGLDAAFSFIHPSKIVDYDAGVRSNYHLIPDDLQCRIDQGHVLTQDELTLVRGLEVIEREQKVSPDDRVKWFLEESLATKNTPASTVNSSGIDESALAAKGTKQLLARTSGKKRGHFRVGQKILKNFPGYDDPFLGEITLLPTADFAYYRVSYEDGDQEDISIGDISKHVAMYHFSEASSHTTAAQFKIGQIIEKKFPGFGRFRGKIIKLPSVDRHFYRVRYQDNDIEDIASDEIGKYVVLDLASKVPLIAAKNSPKRKKKGFDDRNEMTRRVRPKYSATLDKSTCARD